MQISMMDTRFNFDFLMIQILMMDSHLVGGLIESTREFGLMMRWRNKDLEGATPTFRHQNCVNIQFSRGQIINFQCVQDANDFKISHEFKLNFL